MPTPLSVGPSLVVWSLLSFENGLCCAQAFLKCWRRSSSTYCLSSCLGSSKERAREVPRYTSLSSSQCPDRVSESQRCLLNTTDKRQQNPVPEALPGAAFDDQFRQVDAAVRDLQVSELQIPQAGTASDAPYQNFRTTRLDPRQVPVVHYSDTYVYRVVPHRNVFQG